MRLAAFVPVAHQPRLLEYAEMFGHRRLRNAGTRGQRADRRLAIEAQPLEQRAARRVGEHLEQQIGGRRHLIHNSLAMDFSRSEEHTYELQSLMRNSYAVFCLKTKKHNDNIT